MTLRAAVGASALAVTSLTAAVIPAAIALISALVTTAGIILALALIAVIILLGMIIVIPRIGTDEAMLAETDKVFSACQAKSLHDKSPVLRLAPLHKSALHGLVVRCFGNKHRLHGAGIDLGVPHTCGQSAGCGIEILHLLGHVSVLIEPLGQLNGVLQRASGMRRDQIRNKILLLAVALIKAVILLAELLIYLDMRLAHIIEGVIYTVLGCYLELARNMMLNKVGEELAAGVLEQEVEPDARANEYLLYAGDLTQLAQHQHIIGVVGIKVGAGAGRKAGAVAAEAALELLLAGRPAVGGGRAAYIVDITLEAGMLCEGVTSRMTDSWLRDVTVLP